MVSIFLSASAVTARDDFSPAIKVDDMIITNYQLSQRALFFKLLKFPGDHKEQAEKTLIDDRLKTRASERLGIEVDTEALELEMKIFAERANLTPKQFIEQLQLAGVDKSTWVDYLKVPILWFNTVRQKFATEILLSNSNNNSTMSKNTGSEIQVLLTEIIVATRPREETTAKEIVETLRKIKSLEKFSRAAYKYSVAPTKEIGGKITWQNISSLPASVKPLISGLSIGEVTEPLSIPGGIALFQLRDIREIKPKRSKSEIIDFIKFEFEKNAKVENSIKNKVLVCEDLFTFSKKLKKSEIDRITTEDKSLSASLKLTLSNLDENEYLIISENDERSQLVMVCDRKEKIDLSDKKITEISNTANNKRLLRLANSYIENLRQEAQIVYK